jgi:hypothetical protein
MSRLEEVKAAQDALIQGLKDIKDSELNLTQEALIDLNLSSIASQLVDISTTLAIIADKLGGE